MPWRCLPDSPWCGTATTSRRWPTRRAAISGPTPAETRVENRSRRSTSPGGAAPRRAGIQMIDVLERPACTVVGLAIHTRPRSAEIPALWPEFVARIPEIPHPAEPRVTYGVMQFHAGKAAPLFYMAGVP